MNVTTRPRVRTIRTRRLDLDYPEDHLPRHFVSGDLLMSHIVAVLSASFPNGEDFFVESVRNYRARITDDRLKPQVAGFIGQEAMHGREHRVFNDRLDALGYPASQIDRRIGRLLDTVRRRTPEVVQLAMTAALEHYTAVGAEHVLSDERVRRELDVEEVRSLFLWHALEESEHKAVAFDVFQEVSGSYLVRVATMQAVTLVFGAFVVASVMRSLRADPAAGEARRLARSVLGLRRSPWASRRVLSHLLAYNRPGFHPDDRDTTGLLEHWRTELFGVQGSLTDKLRTSPS